jgi:hypothetical protein
MPQSCPDPTLDVAGDEILVTLRGTSYAVTYLKRGGARYTLRSLRSKVKGADQTAIHLQEVATCPIPQSEMGQKYLAPLGS